MFSGYSTDTSRQGLIYIGTDESQANRAVAVVIGGSGTSTIVSLGGLAYSSTPVTSSSDTRIATTAFVKAQGYASLASPTFSGTVSIPTLTLGTALGPTYGGTGIGSYTTGDLLYASATNTLAKRAAGTDGYVLTMSGGVPTWAPGGGGGGGVTSVTLDAGSTGLTVNAATSAEITTFGTFTLGGTLALANGGTGASLTAANGQVAYSTTTALALTSGGSTGQVLKCNSGSAPTWGDVTVPAQPYDLRGKFVGTPASSVVLDTFIADRVATISSTSTDHKFSAKVLPLAGSVILTVQRTRTTLGVPATVTVFTATSSSTDTILNGYYPMTISPVTNGDLLENDVLEVVVQAAAFDAAFATPVFTISAVA